MTTRGGVSEPERVVGYCDQCDTELGRALVEHLGRRVHCPNDTNSDHLHLARVVRIPKGRRWLSLETLLLRWQAGELPGLAIRLASGCPSKATGTGRLLRLGLIVLMGVAVAFATPTPIVSLAITALAIIASVSAVCDILMSITATAFVSRSPTQALRTAFLLLASWLTVAMAFANLYLTMAPQFKGNLTWPRSVYFSVVTLATVGYGDITPGDNATRAQMLVIGEILAGLYLVVVIFSIVLGWSNATPVAARLEVADLELPT